MTALLGFIRRHALLVAAIWFSTQIAAGGYGAGKLMPSMMQKAIPMAVALKQSLR